MALDYKYKCRNGHGSNDDRDMLIAFFCSECVKNGTI